MIDLPEAFLSRMKCGLGEDYGEFLRSYEKPAAKAIRVNTLKISVEDFKKITPFPLSPVPWEESGFYVDGEGLGKTVLHAAGAYYVQEPSAMSVVPKLEVKVGERVLDLCSAPGGKGTQIAQYLNGSGMLVLNEVVPSRRDILAQNVERLGVRNAIISNEKPETLAGIFTEYFDKILVDAPCSGEGMFKKEPNAIPEWSTENVRACAARQKEILAAAEKMLCGGGRIVYSTCTFAPEEDEEQIENFLKAHSDFKLLEMKKLYPHEVRGEGHFYAVLEKTSGGRAADFAPYRAEVSKKQSEILKVYREWESDSLNVKLENLVVRGDGVYFVPDGIPDLSGFDANFQYFTGLGRVDGKNFFPWHSIATRLNCNQAKTVELDEKKALDYLRGRTFDCPQDIKGWRLATFENLPLGWCKAVNGVAKNHYPKGLRI